MKYNKIRRGSVNQNDLSRWVGQRKYCTQLSEQEKDGLFKRLKEIDGWGITGHTLKRIGSKGIEVTYDDIVSAIHNSDIVEYKIDKNNRLGTYEERVVLSSKAIVNRCYRFKAVYSLTEKKIITVWINHIDDNHDTLDWSLYNENMKVFNI